MPKLLPRIVGLMGLALTGAATAQAADAQKGLAVYTANCMACHGTNADGKGPAAAALNPSPANFTSAEFWLTRNRDKIKSTIRSGKPGTPMMAFGKLSDADVDNVVAYLESKRP